MLDLSFLVDNQIFLKFSNNAIKVNSKSKIFGECNQIFNNAIKYTELLIPYVPSSIIIKKPDLKCAVSIRKDWLNKITSTAHFFEGNHFFAYKINMNSIQ